MAQILAACREAFDLAPDAEITSEANPGTVDQERFSALRAMGVNRLSMGVQSFDDEELRWLGRIHGATEAETAFTAARAAGFTNINLDFIFGLPDQRPETWARTLRRAVELGPEHLSLYSLIVEHGTPLADQVRRGLISEPDDDLAADMYEAASGLLAATGYAQYEISNWTIDDRRWTTDSLPSVVGRRSSVCRHNLVYWRRGRTSASARGRTASSRSGAGGTCGRCRSTSAASKRVACRRPEARPSIDAPQWARR